MALNDVVRHVILRIVVDQAGLAQELAAARAKLKELERSEHESNSARAKDFDRVTERIDKQTEAVNRNARANRDQSAEASRGAQGVAQDWQKAAKATEDATKASLNQARIQRDNDRARANTAAQNARAQEKLETQLADLRHQNADTAFLREHTQNERLLADLDAVAAARAKSQQSIATSGYGTDKAAHSATRESYLSDAASSVADKEFARSRDAQDLTERNIVRRRAGALQEARRARQELNNLSARGNILEQQALSIAERRAAAATRITRSSRQRGIGGALGSFGAAFNDVAVGSARSVSSAPKSFRRGLRDYDSGPELLSLGNSMGDLRKEATRGEQALAGFFGVFRRDSTSAFSSTTRLRNAFKGYVSDVRELKGLSNPFAGFSRGASEASGLIGRTRAGVSGFFSTARKDAASGEQALKRFFGAFRSDAQGAEHAIQRVNAGFKSFLADINRPRQGGAGSSLFKSLVANAAGVLGSLSSTFDGIGNRFLSFRTVIVAVVAALGPLAAIMGGVGAAALGLASNLVALSGSLLALPGLITAAVSAFGVLALVMKPLTNVFSAYTAASKAAAKGSVEGSRAAATAANALVDAQARAAAAERNLAEARKQAARGIQDYSLALQRLKFDKEGADLGAKSALREYRRTLADPTASTLDKQIARHAYEGSLNDKQDQAIQAGRTTEDANTAIKKGVDGSDAVAAALSEQAHALQDLATAQKDAAAGGSANRTAQDALQAQLDKLGPKTRKVVEAIHDLAGEYGNLVKRLSEKVFGPLAGDTGKFKDVLKELESFLSPAADALGILADKAISLFTNPDWKRFFEVQGVESGKTIRKLGGALLDVADGFRGIVETSRPFVTFIVDGIVGIAKSFDKFTTSKDGRKAIGDFLKNTMKRMSELKPVITDLFAGFAGFFAALNTSGGGKNDFTTYFNKGLQGAAASFKELGDKARDPNGGFQTWLRNVRPLLHNIVTFLSSAGTFFGKLFSDPRNLKEASGLLQSISTKWLPRLSEIFGELSESGLITKLATAIGKIFGAVEKFLANGGADGIAIFAHHVVNTATAIQGLVDILSNIPGVLTTIGAVLAAVFGVAFFTKFTGINAAVGGVIKLLSGFKNFRDSIKNPLNDVAKGGGAGGSVRGGPAPQKLTKKKRFGIIPVKPKKPGKKGIFGSILDGLTGGATGTQIKDYAKGQVLGDNSSESILKRSERYLRQIEINTRRSGSGGSSGLGGGDDDDPNKPRNNKDGKGSGKGGNGGKGGRRGVGLSTAEGTVNDTLDANNPAGSATNNRPGASGKAATPYYDPNAQVSGVTANPNETRAKTNARRAKAGLRPLPEPIPVTAPKLRNNNDFSIGDTTPIAGRTFADQQRDDVARRRAQRDAERDQRNSPTGRQSRLDAVVDSNERRRNGGGTVPRFDVEPTDRRGRTTEPAQVDTQPNNRRSKTTETGAQKRKRLARERNDARNAGFNAPRPVTVDTPEAPDEPAAPAKAPKRSTQAQVPDRPTDISGAPIADVGDDRRPYTRVGHDEPYTVPTAAETGGKPPSPPRGPGGRITSPYTGTPGLGFPEPNFPGQQVPATETPRRNAQTRNERGQFGSRRPADAVGSGVPDRPSLLGRFVGLNRRVFSGNDEGSFSPTFGIGGRDKDTRSHPNSRRHGASGRRPKRNYSLPAGLGDDDYEDGYEDGLRAGGGSSGFDLPDLDDDDDGKKKPTRKERREARRQGREGASEGTSEGRRGLGGRRGTGGTRRGLTGRLSGLLGGAERAGGRGLAARLGGGLLRGAAGGIGGLVAGAAATLGGDYLINKFVKNDGDANSLSRGLGAVANGAGIGATIGSIIPGVGTVIGGAVGGLAGGAYSLFKDKNLRSFVGDKLGGVGKSVGGFFGGAGSAIKGLFGGGKDDDKPGGGINVKGLLGGALLGPLGALIGGTGIGGKILDSLKKAGGGIAGFFTKTIPDAFHKGMKAISDFFTKTLPGLPRKAFQGFVEALGVVVGFFQYKIPAAAEAAWAGITHFFTETLPNAASAAWAGITGFFTETLPNVASAAWAGITTFFTETLPTVASAAWDGITHFFSDTLPNVFHTVVDSISTFFSVTLPNFFTVTLPDAISKVPGAIKSAIVDPVVNFFSGIKDHIGDIAKGSWSWIKGIFSGAGDSFNKGKDSQNGKMSGGLIEGIYQGIEDKSKIRVTPGEFVIRRSKVQQTDGKRFLKDYNEGRIVPSDFYGGLSASAAPQVISIVPPDARAMAGAAPAVVNNTVNHAPLMGDVTIHNPVREASERSLRRQVEIAAIRHRR